MYSQSRCNYLIHYLISADLRQEIEYLRSLVGEGGVDHASNIVELKELREKLDESEKLMSAASRSWQEKLAETEARKREELEELKVSQPSLPSDMMKHSKCDVHVVES